MGSVSSDTLVYLLVLDEMRLLAKRLRTHLTPKRLLAGVRPQMYFDVALVQKSAITYITPVHWLLFAQQTTEIVRRLKTDGGRRRRYTHL